MISVEQKLSVFTQYLLKKQKDSGKEIIDSAKEKRDQMVKTSEEKIKKEKHNIEERNYQVIFRDKNKIIAQGKNVAKNAFLEQHNTLFEDFKQTIWKVADTYVGTDDYNHYLEKCVKKIPDTFDSCKDIIIFSTSKDQKVVQNLILQYLSDYNVTYKEIDDELVGGIIIRDAENRINCDFSIANLIRDNSKFIGMKLNEIMGK